MLWTEMVFYAVCAVCTTIFACFLLALISDNLQRSNRK